MTTLRYRGPFWMPITPETGSLFHAETQPHLQNCIPSNAQACPGTDLLCHRHACPDFIYLNNRYISYDNIAYTDFLIVATFAFIRTSGAKGTLIMKLLHSTPAFQVRHRSAGCFRTPSSPPRRRPIPIWKSSVSTSPPTPSVHWPAFTSRPPRVQHPKHPRWRMTLPASPTSPSSAPKVSRQAGRNASECYRRPVRTSPNSHGFRN